MKLKKLLTILVVCTLAYSMLVFTASADTIDLAGSQDVFESRGFIWRTDTVDNIETDLSWAFVVSAKNLVIELDGSVELEDKSFDFIWQGPPSWGDWNQETYDDYTQYLDGDTLKIPMSLLKNYQFDFQDTVDEERVKFYIRWNGIESVEELGVTAAYLDLGEAVPEPRGDEPAAAEEDPVSGDDIAIEDDGSFTDEPSVIPGQEEGPNGEVVPAIVDAGDNSDSEGSLRVMLFVIIGAVVVVAVIVIIVLAGKKK